MAKIRAEWYEKHGISRERYNELMWFTRRYDEFREAARKFERGEYDRKHTGNTPARGHADPTANEAMRLASNPHAWKVAAIEQAAVAADARLCAYLLRNVTQDARFEDMPVPCGRNQFFMARRRFFAELHLRLEENGY